MAEPTLVRTPAEPAWLVEQADEVRRAAEALAKGHGPIAIDAERASGFRYGQRAFLIQMRRAGVGTILFDPTTCGSLEAVARVVNVEEWILHAADQDLACLAEVGLYPGTLWDTELAARLLGAQRPGLASVLPDMLGVALAKEHSAADWSRRPIPPSWLNYAALDVEFLIELRERQIVALSRAGKLDWALQEFHHVTTLPLDEEDPERWRRLSGLSKVSSPRGLAVVRALWQERDRRAEQRDLPPNRVMHPSTLLAAALAMPNDAEELAALPEFSTKGMKPQAASWWPAIAAAYELPAGELPPKNAPRAPGELPNQRSWRFSNPEAAARLQAVREALAQLEEELDVPAGNLVDPKSQKLIAWHNPSAEELADFMAGVAVRPWQIDVTAEPLAAALADDGASAPNTEQ